MRKGPRQRAANPPIEQRKSHDSFISSIFNALLGEERVQWLVEQTGTSKDELLVGLSKALPKAVDKLTPDGRVPTAEELERLG